jgi:hypothetical protein
MVLEEDASPKELEKLTKRFFGIVREIAARNLQILVQRFDSASGLQGSPRPHRRRSDPR